MLNERQRGKLKALRVAMNEWWLYMPSSKEHVDEPYYKAASALSFLRYAVEELCDSITLGDELSASRIVQATADGQQANAPSPVVIPAAEIFDDARTDQGHASH